MVLSKQSIIHEYHLGNIVIDPFKEENVNNSSVDVTLGENFYKLTAPAGKLLNPYSESMAMHWRPIVAIPLREQVSGGGIETENISPDEKVIWIGPGESLLGHTQEFIGGFEGITTMMKARSSIGRHFIEVCKCAGWGDIGYVNRWTMELTNTSKVILPLVVGRRIAQIIFMRTEGNDDYTQQSDSKYSHTKDVEKLKKTWTPESMLPKMWLDREVKAIDKRLLEV
jgi:dCTP deaminase